MVAAATPRLSLLLGLVLLLSACAGEGSGSEEPPPTPVAPANGALAVRAFEWGFEPEAIVLQRGEQVTFLLQNDGEVLHNLKVAEELTADVIESVSTGPLSADEGQLFVGADGGDEGTLTFVPLDAGTYAFWCTLEGHRQFGMEGTLVVE